MARRKHSLTEKLTDVRLEGDVLVLYFARGTEQAPKMISTPLTVPPTKKSGDPPAPVTSRRRKRGTRNRMKTRGWAVEAKVVNSRGMTATVYKPFVDALKGQDLSPAEQRSVVARILRSNGNNPQEGSVEYYLSNTIEYLSGTARRI